MAKQNRQKTKLPQIHNAKALYLRIFSYAWQHKLVFLISILATAILALSNTGFLALVKELTDDGFMKQAAAQSSDEWISPQYLLPLKLFILMFIRGVAAYASVYCMRWVARRVVATLRIEAFSKLMLLPVNFFDSQSTGTLVSKLTFDVERLSTITTRTALNVLKDVITIFGLLGYMLYLDWRLTMIFAVIAPLMALYLKKSTPKLRSSARQVQDAFGEMTKVAEEAISGQRIVKVFGAQDYENERFSTVVNKNRSLELRLTRISELNSFVVEMLSAVALVLVVYYALGSFTVGEFAAFVGALLMLISPAKHIASANEDFQIGLAAAQSVFEVIDKPAEFDDGTKLVGHTAGAIEFKNVSLRYGDNKQTVLNDISFSVKPGEKIALVGRSGGGKTTLVNVLPRFYDVQQGVILLDGVDVRALTLSSLRAQFSLVSQDIVLFNDTIYNNIAYGALRPASEADVIAAAKAANAWEFISQMPSGLQNEIGDRGVRLSGGQRQRIAIARAILKNAPILLLDEATSALDTESEQHVQDALDTLMQNRTSIVIAHRLSTIENADRIMVVEQGEIVETGTHAALIQLDGHYAKLYQKQFT